MPYKAHEILNNIFYLEKKNEKAKSISKIRKS